MIKAYVFTKNEVKIVNVKKGLLKNNVLWLNIVNPTKDEIKFISKQFGITHSQINNFLDPEERARLENKEDKSLIIFKAPLKSEKKVKTTSLGVVIGKSYILTIQGKKIQSLDQLAKQLDLTLVQKLKNQYILSQIILRVTRDYYALLDDIIEETDQLEQKILKNHGTIQIHSLFVAKKTLLYFRKALITNRDVLILLEKGGSPFVIKKADIESLRSENLQLMDMEELTRGRLSETLNMHLTTVSNNLNVSMKYFAVIAALFLMPMLITGAYGMNFKVLPLATNPYGFWMMVGIMIVSMTIMFFIFKKKQWI